MYLSKESNKKCMSLNIKTLNNKNFNRTIIKNIENIKPYCFHNIDDRKCLYVYKILN